MAKKVSISEFRVMNARRCSEAFHPNGDWWPIEKWLLAISGECGEALESAWKIPTWRRPRRFKELFQELADVITYCDLAITTLGYKTEDLVNSPTFEATGTKVKFYDAAGSLSLIPVIEQVAGVAMRVGQICNLVKKVIRGDFPIESKQEEIVLGLADVVAYCSTLIRCHSGDPGQVIFDKFEEVNVRVGWPRCEFGGNHSRANCDCDPTDTEGRND